MKFIVLVLVSLVSFTVSGYAQSAEGKELGEDVAAWLQPGEHKAELMTVKSTVSPRQVEISNKIRKAMEKNAAWIRDSLATVSDSTVLLEKLGITQAEFDEYMMGGDNKSGPELVKTGDETLVIKRKKNTITFKGTGRLKVLDSLRFNTVLNSPIYNGKELDFDNKAGSEDTNNPFKSPWSGYHYTFLDLGDVVNTHPDATTANATNITFDIGKLKNNGKTVLMFMLFKTANGKMAQTDMVICLFE